MSGFSTLHAHLDLLGSLTHPGDELTEGNMNEGGWNLVEPEHASSRSMETESSDGASMKEVSSSGKPGLKKEASFAWRGGQERQTTGKCR